MRPRVANPVPLALARLALLLLGLGLSLACAGKDDRPALDVDLRPVMNGLREDARSIALALASRPSNSASSATSAGAALEPAERLARAQFARDRPTFDAAFRDREREFHDAADVLVRTLTSGSEGDSQIAFARLLQRCDACHAEYRPGAARIAP